MNGVKGIPQEWLTKVETASRRNFAESAALLTGTAKEIREKDLARASKVRSIQDEIFAYDKN